MPRRHRFDAPGVLHHVMNRGLARRTVFEEPKEIRYFLSLLAREVRAGRIELVAFAILTTHFHLMVRSKTGELDLVMQRVMNLYVRRFNRARRRDGPLFRSRYVSKPVTSRRYFLMLLRYIDHNAPQARLVPHEALYPFGSAHYYVADRRPRWLHTEQVDALLEHPAPSRRLKAYSRIAGSKLSEEELALVECRLRNRSQLDDDWDSLVGMAPPRVLEWMVRKARLADGTKPGHPYVAPSRVLTDVGRLEETHGKWLCAATPKRRTSAWPMLRTGLLRDLAGLTYRQIGSYLGCAPSLAVRRVDQHARLLKEDELYATRASEVGAAILAGH